MSGESEQTTRAVVACLLAGDVQARVFSNASAHGVEVTLDDGRAYWAPRRRGGTTWWGLTILDADGSQRHVSETAFWDGLSPEEVARCIANYDYDL